MKAEWVRFEDEEPPLDTRIIISIHVKTTNTMELDYTTTGEACLWEGPWYKATHWLKGLEYPDGTKVT